jgi:hypothetical protein
MRRDPPQHGVDEPGPTSDRTRSTVVLMAAWAGTRIESSWWHPNRSASRTFGCTRTIGRSRQAEMTASYSPCQRIVPLVSSVANAASRPVNP